MAIWIFTQIRSIEMMTIGSMYVWRASKGIYRFAPEIYEALISQPLTGDLPTDCLYHLPEWVCNQQEKDHGQDKLSSPDCVSF